jgi:hypothetical protein
MNFLKTLFRRGMRRTSDEVEASEPECLHAALVPHWDAVDDMGNPEKVTRYTCQSCNASFSREEGERMMETEKERLRLAEIERLKEEQEASE